MSAEKTAAILLDELSPKFDGYRRALQQSAAVIVQLEDRVKALETRQPECGEQGPAPTDEQIAKAVAAYALANPPPKGEDGRDADPSVIRQMVADAVAELPKPTDGADADIADLVPAMQAEVKRLVEAIPAPQNGKDADPETIRGMVAEAVSKIPLPQDGKSITPDDVVPLIDEAVAKAVAAIRAPADGRDGEPGPAPTEAQIGKSVADYLSAHPPANGEPGPQGEPGHDAEPIAIEDVTRALLVAPELATLVSLHAAEAVEKHFEASPVRDGADGKDGRDGKDGEPGRPGDAGPRGEKGADGAGIADILIDQSGCAVATFSDGRMKNLGPVIGKDGLDGADGKDGRDGKDGASFDSFDLAYDDVQHEIIVRATAGSATKELRFPAGGIRYKGYWRDGVQAKGGEAYTHDGILWVAKQTTSAKPCVENKDDWSIGARKGRDGRDGKAGRDLGPPPPVKLNEGEGE